MSKLLIANWKANKNEAAALQWFQDFETELRRLLVDQPIKNTVVICPSFPLLPVVHASLRELNRSVISLSTSSVAIGLGLQDISPFGAGSYTGAVSGQNVAWLKPDLVITGHSERRRYFQETSQQVAAKVDQALDLPTQAVVCVDRQEAASQAKALGSLANRVTVAYEPVEAIGTGVHPSPLVVQDAVKEIHQAFGGPEKVLYGGSVDELTVSTYLLVSDGVLVGTAAKDGAQFARLVAAAQSVTATQ